MHGAVALKSGVMVRSRRPVVALVSDVVVLARRVMMSAAGMVLAHVDPSGDSEVTEAAAEMAGAPVRFHAEAEAPVGPAPAGWVQAAAQVFAAPERPTRPSRAQVLRKSELQSA